MMCLIDSRQQHNGLTFVCFYFCLFRSVGGRGHGPLRIHKNLDFRFLTIKRKNFLVQFSTSKYGKTRIDYHDF